MSDYRKKKQDGIIDYGYGRLQPQAPEVEKAVLGALLIDRDAYVEVCELLRSDSFYEPRKYKTFNL